MNFKDADVKIYKTGGYALYSQNGTGNFTCNMDGVTLDIINCATNSSEGGIDIENGTINFISGKVNISNVGNSDFGAMYISRGNINLGSDSGEPLTMNINNRENSAMESSYVIQLQTDTNMKLDGLATKQEPLDRMLQLQEQRW